MKTQKLLCSLFAFFLLFMAYGINAQDNKTIDIRSQDTKHMYPPSYDIIYTTGDSCLGAGHEQHDGNTHANGYGILSDSAKIVQKMRPAAYPWQYTKICVGFTSVSGAPASFNYNIIMYDSTGTGPGTNLLYFSPTQTITTPPAYPLYQWYSSTVTLPVITSGAVYIGVQYDDNPNVLVYVSADENAGTTLWPGYYSTALAPPPVWTTLQTAFASYKALGVRAEGHVISSNVRNFALNVPNPGVNTNYVQIPYAASMAGISNVTIECWVKFASLTAELTAYNKGGASFDYQLGFLPTTGSPFFRAQGVIIQATSITLNTGTWYHVAVTADGNNVNFYVNGGAQTFNTTLSSPLGTSTNEMRIGRGNSDPYAGDIEELRVWNVIRTRAQVDSNKCFKYPSQFSSTAGLKGLWHLDSTYVDSINGWNGTLQGSLSFDTISFPIPGANCNLLSVQSVSNLVPKMYSLEQNYPNPFNPTTVIKFSITKGEFVEMKLYDILGNEVKTLVKSPFQAGTYSVGFDASNLASGVYFYKIVAGDFTQTKKMLLIK